MTPYQSMRQEIAFDLPAQLGKGIRCNAKCSGPAAQVVQAAPPVPQAELVSAVMQLFPLQQPWPHEFASHLHAPALHSWPEAQMAHATPPVPHVALPEAWQRPLLSQHPFGHDVASQTHLPWALHS